jgi:hypothetical protein
MKPRFSASEVAGILGRNPYKTKNEVLVKVLSQMPQFKEAVLAGKTAVGGRTDKEFVDAAPHEVHVALAKCVRDATVAKSDAEVESIVSNFKDTNARVLLKECLDGMREVESPEVVAAKLRIHTGQTTIDSELERLAITKEVRTKIDALPEQEVLASEIQKRRGTKLEKTAEDAFAAETGKAISERNTFAQLECPEYRLIGYIDGYQDGRIVETKNRKRFWPVPPAYDFVQLRCYMRMRGKIPGVLLENFPGKPPRTTDVPWDDDEWESIHEGLCAVSAEIGCMTPEAATSLAREVFLR